MERFVEKIFKKVEMYLIKKIPVASHPLHLDFLGPFEATTKQLVSASDRTWIYQICYC